ncbi:arylsulfatase B-like [Ruditapes philippinarum]|uniref:arylsulfatase B-like n=1 Tax=Ruditapes philippinarum TaxID=129788 RepID=UPI00295BCC71|nr:arylsulfatase B-like [Ruditapes philippinarum]
MKKFGRQSLNSMAMSSTDRIRFYFILAVASCTLIFVVHKQRYYFTFQTTFFGSEFNDLRAAGNKTRPHIKLIIADDLGYNDVGYHGSRVKTPNIDKLALSGVRLENYYVQPICTPTRGQLLTGRHQIYTGLQWVLWPSTPLGLDLDSTTIADKLKEAGYATHIVGKWHVGFYKKEYLPTNRGFQTFFGFQSGHSNYFTHETVDENMKGYDLMENDQPANISKYLGVYSTNLFTNRVKSIIHTHDKSKLSQTHLTLIGSLTVMLSHQKIQHRPINQHLCISLNITLNNNIIYVLQIYTLNEFVFVYLKGQVSCIDEGIGSVVESLKQSGMWDNTVLIFTTDNGGQLNEGSSNYPLKGGTGSLWEGGIRAAGFVTSVLLNDKVKGSVSKELMHVTDWFPTLINLAGGNLNVTKPLDGFDQWKSINGLEGTPRSEILIDIKPINKEKVVDKYDNIFNSTVRTAIRIGRWKLITSKIGSNGTKEKPVWLFDIVKDPVERHNLAKSFQNEWKACFKELNFIVKEWYLAHCLPETNGQTQRSGQVSGYHGYNLNIMFLIYLYISMCLNNELIMY